MNTNAYIDKLWNIFTNDPELVKLLQLNPEDDASYAEKYHEQDRPVDEFEADSLPFIAFYFTDAATTKNDFMNLGFLYIDIYAGSRDDSTTIRDRIVELMHKNFDERVRAEGQRSSGVKNVYKYRVAFTPLVLS